VTTTKPRAGRNLPAAFAVGGGLAAVVLAALLLWRPAFLAVIVAAIAVAIWEMVRAVRVIGARPPLVPLLGGGTAMAVAAWFWGPEALSLGLFFTVLAVVTWRLRGGPAGYHRDVSTATLIAVYVPFLGGFAALLASPDDGQWRVLTMLVVVVLTDTGGYVAGVFLGRHLMAPSISPKKSWEGLAGSLLAAAAGGAACLVVFFDVDWWWGAVCGLLVAAAAVLGDLAESLLKRDLGVKDMSTLLPGHGGLMDRLDSVLFALPAAYLLLSVLAE
jgi:phosphatidate cytidylyltransferase